MNVYIIFTYYEGYVKIVKIFAEYGDALKEMRKLKDKEFNSLSDFDKVFIQPHKIAERVFSYAYKTHTLKEWSKLLYTKFSKKIENSHFKNNNNLISNLVDAFPYVPIYYIEKHEIHK